MNEQIKYFARLTSTAVFSFIKINLLGVFSTSVVSILGFIILSGNTDTGSSTNVGVVTFLVELFSSKPLGSILFCITIAASPFLFFMLGNRYIVSKLIHAIVKDKSERFMYPVLDKILIKIKDNPAYTLRKGEDYSIVKQKIIQQLKNEKENRWIKILVAYGLKKIHFDDIDFQKDNFSFTETIKSKVIEALQNASEPSKKSIWLLLMLQWFFLLLIWILPY